jgi:hypothetical protein
MNTKIGLLALSAFTTLNLGFSQPVTFTKITTGNVVTDLGVFTTSVWGDFNNRGFQDLFVANWYWAAHNVFYRNNGDGTFTSMTQGAPLLDADNHISAAAGDYDNDGSLDLFVSTGFGSTASVNSLYHNNGDGSFSRVSAAGAPNPSGSFFACAWADYDHDGFLDLMIGNYGDNRNLLWRNNGDGSFTNVTSVQFVKDSSLATAFLWADYENQGTPNLLVLNVGNNANNYIYRITPDGGFVRVLTNVIATDTWTSGSQGGAWGDYDNDGFQDLFVTDAAGERNRLYHNNGDGTFTSVGSGPMLVPAPGSSPLGCAWGDYDNDGYLDLIVCSDNGTNALFHNNGDGTFTRVLSGDPVNDGGPGVRCNAPSWADYDNDGFLDLFVSRGQDQINQFGPVSNLLFHNNGNTNAWLEVKCLGTVSNRSAIGAKVRVKAVIGGKMMWQVREIRSGGGWSSTGPLVAHFGLRDSTNVDTVRIEWPSGAVQELHTLAPKQILTVTEPPRLLPGMTNGIPQFWLKGGRGFRYEVEASTDLTTWSPVDTLTITNLNGTAAIIDSYPPGSNRRFYRAVQQ